MPEEIQNPDTPGLYKIGALLLDSTGLQTICELWKVGHKIIRGLASEESTKCLNTNRPSNSMTEKET